MTPWLTLTIFLPLAGAAVIVLLPGRARTWPRWVALLVALVELGLVWRVASGFDVAQPSLQLIEEAPWAPGLGIGYKVGVDGLSLPLVVLTAGLLAVAVVASWRVEQSPKAFFALLLGLETTMIGVFVALDVILFYVFWEAVLIPMYFLIGRWGSADRRYAALKFFLYTLTASVIMLAGLIGAGTAAHSFDYQAMVRVGFSPELQAVLFWALFLGFAVKVPIVPFHTWLPIAHVEAPTAGSMLLAGVLLKMGGYGLLRFLMPFAPLAFAAAAPWFVVLGVVNIIWGALMALAQKDLKRLVAFSSVSHMGIVVLGAGLATSAAISGAVFMMVSHGVVSALAFFMVGAIYERTHTRQIAEIGGLARTVPVLAGVWLFTSLASLGLPGLSGFVPEFVVIGQMVARLELWALLPASAMVLTAAYYLWTYQRIGMGEPPDGQAALPELSAHEWVSAAPLMAASAMLGVAPDLLARATEAASRALAALVGGGA